MKRVIRLVQDQRNQRYALLKDFDHGNEVDD
jgi:hypothetical protein